MKVLRFIQIASLIIAGMYSVLLATYDGLSTLDAVFLIGLIVGSIVVFAGATCDIRHLDKGDR